MTRLLPAPDLCLFGALLLIGAAMFVVYNVGSYAAEKRELERLRKR